MTAIDLKTLPLAITIKHVKALAGISTSTIDRLERDGRMPASFKPTKRMRRWHRDQILKWIDGGMSAWQEEAQAVAV